MSGAPWRMRLTCAYCGKRFARQSPYGKPARYCCQTCRQRAYELRHDLTPGRTYEQSV
jgi:hypothetical protein